VFQTRINNLAQVKLSYFASRSRFNLVSHTGSTIDSFIHIVKPNIVHIAHEISRTRNVNRHSVSCPPTNHNLRYEVLTLVKAYTVVLQMTLCSLVGGYQHFEATCCLHLPGVLETCKLSPVSIFITVMIFALTMEAADFSETMGTNLSDYTAS
jgi:hypothetical protein